MIASTCFIHQYSSVSNTAIKNIDSSPHRATYMRQWTGSALVQIMACCLFSSQVNWTLRKKLTWNSNQNRKVFNQENVICIMAAILSRGRWVKKIYFDNKSCVIWYLMYWAMYQIQCDDHSNTSTTQISVTSRFFKLPLGSHDKRTFSIMTHSQVLYSPLDNTQREWDKRQIHPRGARLFSSVYDDGYHGTEESICIIEEPVNYLSPVQIYPCWHFRTSTLLAYLSYKWNLSWNISYWVD